MKFPDFQQNFKFPDFSLQGIFFPPFSLFALFSRVRGHLSSDHPKSVCKVRPETVGGVERTRYILPIHFCSIRAQKKSKLKMQKM